jgi:hypothetical protein
MTRLAANVAVEGHRQYNPGWQSAVRSSQGAPSPPWVMATQV